MTNETQSSRTISEFSIGRRIAGSVVVFVALAFGAVPWVHSGNDGAAIEPAQQQSDVRNAVGQVEYFPAQYVNQAKQPEEHIQAF
jgi:hypothetical protein